MYFHREKSQKKDIVGRGVGRVRSDCLREGQGGSEQRSAQAGCDEKTFLAAGSGAEASATAMVTWGDGG